MDRDRDRRYDRDRERDRDRDRDRYGGGESYRPGRSPVRDSRDSRDSFRPDRSPPRRGPPPADTYIPSSSRAARPRSPDTYRRRSRSPRQEFRGRDAGSWRERPRSPPRRRYSPPPRADTFRRDDRPRSPPRGSRPEMRYARSPSPRVRERSPLPLKRSREVSPMGSRGMRSPPPAKRERFASPPRGHRYEEPRSRGHSPPRRGYSPPARERGGYRSRSRSPRRDERIDPYAVDTWRRGRSPSPPRASRADISGPASVRDSGSGDTSRRSSPPIHPSRLGRVADERPTRPPPMEPGPRSPQYRERSRERPMDYRRDSPPPRERDYGTNSGPAPSAPLYRNGESSFSRAPPSGPGASRNFSSPALTAPIGPSSSSMSMSAHNRASNNPILSAPSRPRGGGPGRGGYGREYPGDYHGRDYPPAPPRRGSAQYASSGRGGGYGGGGPPVGPRGPPPAHYHNPPFRGSSNSTSTTYPRTQRFNNPGAPTPTSLSTRNNHASSANASATAQYLADLPQPVPGGKRMPELYDTARAARLEDEARRLREVIAEKQAAKRRGLAEWEALERESGAAGLRAELAEESLRGLSGEGEVGAAF